jgi:hypothetical protein
VAVAVGAIGWEIASRLGGRTEAWDSPAYWRIAYPLFGAATLALAYFRPRSAAFTWVAIAFGQGLVMFVRNPDGSLLPLGVIALLVMSAPLLIAGRLGVRLHDWRAGK